ncbi:diguanylate cyclase [Acidaminobacter sp. JC074]|uniref:diguanylate cyclase n=1 Tax=Acidaminobacter sp. JC074 TaxID=2530199 RepID=UPI001F0FA821|nr:diguanylate cyclase [Acidaminobacter sp. JC074]MCH4890746.1 diguanylate cyclase [Acidaminobacter sp. JC074]
MKQINYRYNVIEIISTDAFGEILLVEDIKNKMLMHMRLFSPEFSQNELMIHYQVNYVHYSTMVYPNLYRNYKFDIVKNVDKKVQKRRQFFYTYEKSIDQEIDYMDLTRQEAIEVLIEISAALKYLHFRGYVYKYLTFDHIHIYRTDNNRLTVKLSDLASVQLYRDVMRSEKTYHQFIAPEVFWKERHNAQADIYSLGIVFYYLYHRYSFKNKTVDESLRKNLKNAVDKIVSQMIRLSVVDEITSIDDFVKHIDKLLNMSLIIDDREYYEKLQLKAPILERFDERAYFVKTVADKFNKNSDANGIIISGDIGTGKSRILDEAETILRWEGHRVIRVDCHNHSSDYNMIVTILKQIVEFGDLNQELIMKYGSELVKFLPDYEKIWGVLPAEPLEEHIEQMRIRNRVQNFLREYSHVNQIVFVLDDMHQLNNHQIELMHHLLITRKENQYFIIGSYETDSEYVDIYKEWEASSKILVKKLNNFNYDQASQFVSSLLGVGHNPIELTAKVMRDANGNLKQIKQIVMDLFNKGYLYLNNNHAWRLDDQYDEADAAQNFEDIEAIDVIDDHTQEILDHISLFKSAASLELLLGLLPNQSQTLNETLKELTSIGVLKMKYDDYGETYDFLNKYIKKNLVESLNKRYKEQLHLKIANALEQDMKKNNLPCNEEIIYHFSGGNMKSKAVEYCVILASDLEKKHMYLQSIEIYNKALGILHSQTKTSFIAEIYYKISRVYHLIGESELTFNFAYKALDTTREFENQETAAKTMILLADQYAKRRDMVRCRQYIETIMGMVKHLDDKSIYFEVQVIELKLSLYENDLDRVGQILDQMQPLEEYERAEYLTYVGLLSLRLGELGEALSAFNEAKGIYDLHPHPSPTNILMPTNLIGELYAFYLDDLEAGRSYFSSVIEKLELWNLRYASATYIRNHGMTYLLQDDIPHAERAFIHALDIAEKNMDSFSRADVCKNLCQMYLKSENYQKASFYLKKLESEYEDFYNNHFVSVDFYMIHIEFYLYLKDYDLASQWCKKLRNSSLNVQQKEEFTLRVFEYEVEIFRKQYFNYTANVDLKFIEVLVKTHSNLIEAKVVRTLILRLAINLMNYKKYIDVHYLLKLDDELKVVFDTPMLSTRHDILKGVLKDQRVDYFEDYLSVNLGKLSQENVWLLYKILGDEYYDHYDYYQAIKCYFNAFNVLRDLSDFIPKDNKENYIFCDEVKLDLKSKLNNIHRKLVGHSYKEKTVYTELEIRKADDFFDLTDYKNFVMNKSVQSSIGDIYKKKHGIILDSVSTLIQNFGKNEIENIQLILKYCTQILMGDRGYVFILDDNGEVKEVIKNNPDSHEPNLDAIIKSSVNINKGLLVHSVYDLVRNYPFLGDQKGLLCIPIIKRDATIRKRRSDDREDLVDVKGYMYIDAKEAFNNFTQAPFEECMSLMNMLYFFVDNYNLKRISTIDKLTEVYLRSYFEDMFSRHLQRAKTNADPVSVVMLDIDKFKNINDTYGHRKGDEILYKMCQVIKQTVRETDLIGRYGGEEFILVFPNTSKENALIICEKIRKAVESTPFLKDDKPVTISLGVSSYPDLGLVEEELIEKADQALYASKNNGRNQTTLWHPDLGESRLRFDKLAGILEGNISTDTRNVQAIIDIMNIVKDNQEVDSKIELILKTVSDVCEAQQISLVAIKDQEIDSVNTKYTGDDKIYKTLLVDKNMIMKYINKNKAEYFINWNDTSELDDKNVPNWKSLIVSPLRYKDENKGILIVSVPISTKEFSFNTTNFVNAISGVIASII